MKIEIFMEENEINDSLRTINITTLPAKSLRPPTSKKENEITLKIQSNY